MSMYGGMGPIDVAAENGDSRVQAMMSAGGQQPKGDVDYRVAQTPEQSCATCANFDGQQGCAVVAGTIDPRGVSNAYTPVGPSTASQETEAEAPLA